MNVYKQDCSKFEKYEKLGCAALDLYQTIMNTGAPDGADKYLQFNGECHLRQEEG